ncbi:glycosyltransferase [Sphaerisporangium sp. B11E5]|uniref:glycosyltransferase n=1 Tax=Sphaerisporangium sp. B11E5 TaxID=3153563 RepID=UPI00325CCA5F
MKIAIVALHELPADIPAIAREFPGAHKVTVYTRRDSADRKPRVKASSKVTVEYVAAGPAHPVAEHDLTPHIAEFSAHLAARWRKDRPDVVHAWSWTGGLAAVAAGEGLGIPLVQSFPTLGTSARRRAVSRSAAADRATAARVRVERAIGRRADAVVATCAAEAAELIRLGVPRGHIVVVPHGVDVERFRRQGPAAPHGERHRLLLVGPLAPEGGAAVAIRALDAIPDAELVVAGDGTGEEHIERLRILAKEAGVEDRVTLLSSVPPNSLPKMMRGADIVLSLPATAPEGKVVLEAMACGVPVIATAVGAHADSVVDGVTGLLVRPGDPALLALRARRLLGDLTRRTAMGFAGADRAKSRYSLERIARELVRVYEQATGQAQPMDAMDGEESEAA